MSLIETVELEAKLKTVKIIPPSLKPINNEPVYTSEFESVYKKNQNLITETSQGDVESYLDLFVSYKLKVQQAKEYRLDTFQKLFKLLTLKSKHIDICVSRSFFLNHWLFLSRTEFTNNRVD